MKKVLLLVAAFLLLSVQGFSQFGIKGGLNFNKMSDIDIQQLDQHINNSTGFNAGILYRFKVPVVGLAIQPELIYSQTSCNFGPSLKGVVPSHHGDLKVSNLMLPVSLQMGMDLILLRPFIQVAPYIGYTLSASNNVDNLKFNAKEFKYGIGLGAGIDIWKLQVSGRYNWELSSVADFEWDGIESVKGGKNKGFELSVAFFF